MVRHEQKHNRAAPIYRRGTANARVAHCIWAAWAVYSHAMHGVVPGARELGGDVLRLAVRIDLLVDRQLGSYNRDRRWTLGRAGIRA